MPSAPQSSEPRSWPARPILSVAVTVAAVSTVAVGALAGVAVARMWVPEAAGAVALLARIAGAFVGAVLAGLVARRLLTLSRLLRLSLVFPDDLPSRFTTALRVGASTRRLRELRDSEPAERVVLLAASIAAHDRETRGHSERVRAYTEVIALRLGIEDEDLDRLRWASLLHDVGKLRVPRHVLSHTGRLDEEAWSVMRRHPEAGDQLVSPLRTHLGRFADTVLHHHERFDGAGYPDGLAGDRICLGARIVAVADAFEVMTGTSRRYRIPDSLVEAREELVRCSGTQFDPEVVRAFVTTPLDTLRRVVRAATWGLPVPLALATAPAGGHLEHALPLGAKLPDGSRPHESAQPSDEALDTPDDLDAGPHER